MLTPVQPSHLRFHEPFFSFLSFFSSPLPKVRFLLCLLCNRRLPGTRRMEVRSQISFRRGRTSFYPSSAGLSLPAAWISFPVITALFVFLLGTRFGCPIGFQRRHHRPPRRKGLQTIVRVPRRVLFSTFSLRAPPPPSSPTFTPNSPFSLFLLVEFEIS